MPHGITRPAARKTSYEYFVFCDDVLEKPFIQKIDFCEFHLRSRDKYIINVALTESEALPADKMSEISNTICRQRPSIAITFSTNIISLTFPEKPTLDDTVALLSNYLPTNGFVLSSHGPYMHLGNERYNEHKIMFKLTHGKIKKFEMYSEPKWYHNPATPFTRENIISNDRFSAMKTHSFLQLPDWRYYLTAFTPKERNYLLIFKAMFFSKSAQAASELNAFKKLPPDMIDTIAARSCDEQCTDEFAQEAVKQAKIHITEIMQRFKKT